VLAFVVATGARVKQYTADTFILLSSAPAFDFSKGTRQPVGPSDPFVIRAETEVIQSAATCRTVIEQLGLVDNPGYNDKPPLVRILQSTVRSFQSGIFGNVPPPDDHSGDKVDAAVSEYQSRLAVVNDGRSPAVHIRFTAATPQLAAGIANRHANVYIAEQLKQRNERGEQIISALEAELSSRARDLATSQAQVQQFQRTLVSGTLDPATAEGELRALELVASSKRDAYSAVLAAFNTALSDQRLSFPDARIVSPALPSSSKASSIGMFAIAIGAVSISLGLCVGFVRDLRQPARAVMAGATQNVGQIQPIASSIRHPGEINSDSTRRGRTRESI
jgi:uncharacterized protein involved in exopolysaccharide biosynthesis